MVIPVLDGMMRTKVGAEIMIQILLWRQMLAVYVEEVVLGNNRAQRILRLAHQPVRMI